MKAKFTIRFLFALAFCLSYWPAVACQTQSGAAPSEGATQGQAPARADEPAATPATPSQDPFARIPRMKVEELAEELRQGRAVAVDVRPAEAFAEERIPGAVSLPEEDVVEGANRLPKDKLVVAYCA